jgi:endonuclease/exonuclease/phosphatase family metal-dependent hydrolase
MKSETSNPYQNQEDLRVRILTLNTWGIPVYNNDRPARMKAIGAELGRMDLDVALLQEVFLEEDRKTIASAAMAGGLVNAHQFSYGPISSGLFILSRYPFEAVNYWPFRLNGRPQDLRRPDYYARKGLARVRMKTAAGPLDVYDTHLVAPYLEIGRDIYFSHRVAQAYEIGRWVREHSKGVPAIVAGDFNTTPENLTYRTCRGVGMLEDSYAAAHPGDPGVTVTIDIPYLKVHEPDRVDYIFYLNSGSMGLEVLSSEVVFKEVAAEFRGEILAYSDHYGVQTTFKLASGLDPGPAAAPPPELIGEIRQVWQAGLKEAQNETAAFEWRSSLGVLAFLLVTLFRKEEKFTRSQFLKLFLRIIIALALLFTGISAAILGFEYGEERAFKGLLASLDQVH